MKPGSLVAIDKCGCVTAAIVDDVAFTGKAALRRFYIEAVGMEIRRVKAEDYRGIDICEHCVTRDQQARLFGSDAYELTDAGREALRR